MGRFKLLLLCLVFIFLFFTSGLIHAAIFTVTNLNDSGIGSLRWAIEQANAKPGADRINFDISGAIFPLSALPAITDHGTMIDASSQWKGVWPGGKPGIMLDGSMTGDVHGLSIAGASNCRIYGLFIANFQGWLIGGICISDGGKHNYIGGTDPGYRNVISMNNIGIYINNAHKNVIAGNYIGTDATGTQDIGNTTKGILMHNGAQANIIGGNKPGERNIISGNGEDGVSIIDSGTDSNVVLGNCIGTDVYGIADLGNSWNGVRIENEAKSNIIGGKTSKERNIISGNKQNGVLIAHAGTSSNVVSGNYIGTDVSGTAALGNGVNGVVICDGSHSNIVGGKASGERNIISGNNECGVRIGLPGADNNIVSGNYIGTDVTGTVAIGNSWSGIDISEGAQSNIIGGRTLGERNVVSGNYNDGVTLEGSGTNNNVVSGNFIGTDANGNTALGNGWTGLDIKNGAQSNIIGGKTKDGRNIISGNNACGVRIGLPGTDNNVVSGNYIGTDVTGTVAIGNSWSGIDISEGAQSNIIGGRTSGERNVVSGNYNDGVTLEGSGTNNNVVSGNYVGIDTTGTADLGNGWRGIGIYAGAQSNIIGGTTNGERNIVSGNESDGVRIEGLGTNNNKVLGNYIGTNVNGTIAIGNGWRGVRIENGPQSNSIVRNILSGNNEDGVSIIGSGANNNVVSGNYIGTNVSGTTALGNGWHGVTIEIGAKSNMIGGKTPGERNVISGNKENGVAIVSSGTDNNVVSGNYIGTNVTGTVVLANGGGGVVICSEAQSNIVGGTTPAERNIISGNHANGIAICDPGTNNNIVSGNYIGTDVTGTVDLGNLGSGVCINNGACVNIIGGKSPGERNVISGNDGEGVVITGANNNMITANYIGINATGTAGMGNKGNGILIWDGAQSNTIGGFASVQGNVISGNNCTGVSIGGTGTNNNVVSGNFIGTDTTGTADLGNGWRGAGIYAGAQANIIGGKTKDERNIISGNNEHGVAIADSGTDNNIVSGNYIGTDVSGTNVLGNGWRGVCVSDGAKSNTIGGKTEDERNIISGNNENGVSIIGSGADGNVVSGNYIGTNVSGTTALGNGWHGVTIEIGAKSNMIGGKTPAERNVISGNKEHGVAIVSPGTDNNIVLGNYIGTDVSGTSSLGNSWRGVCIESGAQANTIAENMIAFSGESGVIVWDNDTDYNKISQNSIYDNTGLGIDLGNGGNNEIPSPAIESNNLVDSILTVSGNGAGDNATVEFFKADSSVSGEGKTYLGSLTSDESGNFSGSMDVTGKGLSVGDFLVATTTHTDNNTSEFSQPCLVIGSTAITIKTDIKPGSKPKLAPPSFKFKALEAYPQPFNPEVWIPYTLGKDAEVRITIYDVSGRLIHTLHLGHQDAGAYVTMDKAAYWDGKNEAGEQVASGIYYYIIQAENDYAIKKIVIVK